MNRFLLMGPMPEPYTGQSVGFSIVVNHLLEEKNNKCTIIDLSNKDSIIKGIALCFTIFYHVIFYKHDIVYFTCSRSFAGSIRDVTLLFWCKFKKVKVVNHLHGSDFKSFYDSQPSLYKSILRWCYKSVDTSIVLLDKMKAEFSDFPDMKIAVIPNCYSNDLDKLPTQKTEEKTTLNLLYLSNIIKSKGIIDTMAAFDNIASKHKNINLSIAGKIMADNLSDITSITKEFNGYLSKLQQKYPDRIKYLGSISGEVKKKTLWNSDIFTLPTYYKTEAFPISIIEAMRAGTYIISTDYKYIPYVISSENGSLIKPDSVDSLTEALSDIIEENAKLRSVQNYNINEAIEKYSEEQYLSRVKNIICPK